LALKAPIFSEFWQDQVATATANVTLGTLGERPSVTAVVELAKSVLASGSELAERFLGLAPAGSVACKAGCAHCCYQPVAVTVPEALAVVEHLKHRLSAAELARVANRVAEAHARSSPSRPVAERFSPEHPCPFLEAGQCSVYEVRPLSCRGMNSRDASGCETVLRDPERRAQYHSQKNAGFSHAQPIRAVLSISAGLQLALSEVYQLDARPVELTAAVHLLLSGPESLAARWISGEAPLAAARSVDQESDALVREIGGFVEPAAGG
jgi:Fe-S-cluster containining protein